MNSRPTIVIIEDDEDDFLLLKELLEENFQSHEIIWFAEAPDVDELLGKHQIDLLIVDYRLSNTSGDDYIREIRGRDTVVGVILLTGVPTRSLDFKASEIGASDFLSKDEITNGALERSIRFTLESVRQKRELHAQTVRMENILKSTKMVLCSVNENGARDLFYSESVQELTGYSKKELEEGTVKWMDLVDPLDKSEVTQLIHRVKMEGRVSHKYRIRSKDGQLVWIEEELHCSRLYNGGDSTQIEVRIQDVSSSHEKEQRILFLANTLECAGDGILITEAELERPGPKIVYANQAMLDMTGYERDELIGRTPRLMQGPKTDRKTLDQLKTCLKAGHSFDGMTTNRRKDGTDYCVSWGIRPLKDADGKVTHYVSVQRDITEDQKQRLKLQHSEAFLQAMGQSGNIGGWRCHLKNGDLVWTEQVYAICKLDPSEPPRMEAWLESFPGEYRNRLESARQQCQTDGVPFTLELSFRDQEGEDLWIRMTGEPQYEGSKIVGMWGTFQDITEWHDHDFRYRTFFNLSIDLSAVFSESGHILELNGNWEAVTGLSHAEMKGRSFQDFVIDADIERSTEIFYKLQSNEGVYNFENAWEHVNGEIVHLLWNAKIDPATKTIFTLCRDITEIKKKEILLQDALERAEVANQSKNQFLMAASHELRTPLNPILGFADVLADEITDPEHLKLLEMISEAGTRLTSIVSDILEISSIESGQVKLMPQVFNLSDKIESVYVLLSGKATESDVTLKLVRNALLDELKTYTLRADRSKIRQVLFNLLANGIKFSPGGEVTLEVERIDRRGEKLSVTIAVHDNGIGIPESELVRIFERFHQVSMTETRRFGGQGLGLAICNEFAKLLGGEIHVESRLDQGSVFRFDLEAEIVGQDIVDVNPVTIESDQAPVDAGAFRILIAEDDLMNQRVIQKYLNHMKLAAVVVGDGQEAVRVAAKETFALILMDLQMPKMSGIDACLEIRNSAGPNQHTKIFALTAHVDKSAKEKCIEVGMDGFLEKPISIGQFKDMVEALQASRQDGAAKA